MGMTDELHEDANGSGGEEARPVFRRAVHPDVVLGDELAGLGISLATFARQIAVPTSDVSRIVNGQRQLTARMALRLGHWFGTGPEFWLNLQAQHDLALAERESGEAVRRLPTKETPLPPPRPTGRPRKRWEPMDDREVHRADELPAEWVAELEKPIPPYETPLDDVVDGPEPGTEARARPPCRADHERAEPGRDAGRPLAARADRSGPLVRRAGRPPRRAALAHAALAALQAHNSWLDAS